MIVLDTHAWIWLLADPDQLSDHGRAAVLQESKPGSLVVSAISVWELCTLVKKGRLQIDTTPAVFVNTTYSDERFRVEPVDEVVGMKSVDLPDVHSDPADRIVLATAMNLGCPVMSKDKRFHEYGVVPVIW